MTHRNPRRTLGYAALPLLAIFVWLAFLGGGVATAGVRPVSRSGALPQISSAPVAVAPRSKPTVVALVKRGALCRLTLATRGRTEASSPYVRASSGDLIFTWTVPGNVSARTRTARVLCRAARHVSRAVIAVSGSRHGHGRIANHVLVLQVRSGLPHGFGSLGRWKPDGALVLSGSGWFYSHGVNVYSSGFAGNNNSLWQCVELAERFIRLEGFSTGISTASTGGYSQWAAANMYNNAGSEFQKHPQGSGYLPAPGDLVVFKGYKWGHVAVVDSVLGNAVNIVQQNATSDGKGTLYLEGPNLSGEQGLSVIGVLHPARDPYTSSSPNQTPVTNWMIAAAAGADVYASPGTSSAKLVHLPDGASVTIVCQEKSNEQVGGSYIWDEISYPNDNDPRIRVGWVADYFVNTPVYGDFTPGLRQCNPSAPPQAPPLPMPPPPPSSPFGPTVGVWPAGSLNPPGQQDVFWKGYGNNGMWEGVWNNSWIGPAQVPAVGNVAASPSATVNSARNEEDIWWEGTDGQLYIQYWNGRWNGPVRLGFGPLGSAPSGDAWPVGTRNPAGQEDAFWHGAGNNGLWEAIFNPAIGWSGPYNVPNVTTMASAPSAVVNAPRNEEDVWWEGTDSQLYIDYWNGQWNGPIRLGMGPLGSAPSGAVWPSGTRNPAGQEDVFWKGYGNNGLWEAIFNPTSGWSGPYSVPNVNNVASAPAVVVNGPRNEEEVFYKGTDNQLWEVEWAGQWIGPHIVSGMGPLG